MTSRQAEAEIRRMLLRIRRAARRISREEIFRYEEAVRVLTDGIRAGGSVTLSAVRARALAKQAQIVLAQIDAALESLAARSISRITTEVQREYVSVHARLLKAQGLESGGVALRFEVLPAATNRRLYQLYGRNETLGAIIGRTTGPAEEAVARYIRAATGKAPDQVAVRSILRLLRGQLPVEVPGIDLDPKELTPARALVNRGRRIIGTESFHTMREASAAASEESPFILIARWMLSDRHHDLPSSPDECDDLAEGGRRVDGTPGWYEPEGWPVAPHPNCECYQGDVRVISPEEWAAALRAQAGSE
jgi:hypothetical protein